MHLGIQLLAAVGAHVHTHAYGHKHMPPNTDTHTGILNEYVCPAEGRRRKMNSSVVLRTVLLSLPVKAE